MSFFLAFLRFFSLQFFFQLQSCVTVEENFFLVIFIPAFTFTFPSINCIYWICAIIFFIIFCKYYIPQYLPTLLLSPFPFLFSEKKINVYFKTLNVLILHFTLFWLFSTFSIYPCLMLYTFFHSTFLSSPKEKYLICCQTPPYI